MNRNIIDRNQKSQTTVSPISREDVDQLESVITKTIENTKVQEVEAEIVKIVNERKAATEKVMEIDPELQSIVTADDFLPIFETFSGDEAGNGSDEPADDDYIVEDSNNAKVENIEIDATKATIKTTTKNDLDNSTFGKIDDVTIRTDKKKVRETKQTHTKKMKSN